MSTPAVNEGRRAAEAARVEAVVGEWLGGERGAAPERFDWQPLTGTGSTSRRSLLVARISGDRDEGTLGFVVKRYAIPGAGEETCREQAQREYAALRFLAGKGGGVWHAPAPVAFLPESATIVMEHCAGENLNRSFWSAIRGSWLARLRADAIESLVRDTGVVLRALQGCEVEDSGLPVADAGWYTAFLDEQLAALGERGVPERLRGRIRARVVEALPEMLSPRFRCFQHTDFYFNNLLRTDRGICVLDFPNACVGTAYWDVSHLLVSLEDYKRFRNVDPVLIDRCKEAVTRLFGLEGDRLRTMQLVHHAFSFQLSHGAQGGRVRRLLTRRAGPHYLPRLTALLEDL